MCGHSRSSSAYSAYIRHPPSAGTPLLSVTPRPVVMLFAARSTTHSTAHMIHVCMHRFGFRAVAVLHLSSPIQVRIHPTHAATRATYAYAFALFVLTRHSFTRKRTLSFGHTCPVVLFARVGQYVNVRPVLAAVRVCCSPAQGIAPTGSPVLRCSLATAAPTYGVYMWAYCERGR